MYYNRIQFSQTYCAAVKHCFLWSQHQQVTLRDKPSFALCCVLVNRAGRTVGAGKHSPMCTAQKEEPLAVEFILWSQFHSLLPQEGRCASICTAALRETVHLIIAILAYDDHCFR